MIAKCTKEILVHFFHARIVTIVVLIILATISLNLLMNGNIIGRAEQSKEMQARATELERLELVKGDVAIDNKGKVTVDDYIKEAIKQGITTEDEVEDNGDGSKNIITDNEWNVNIAPDPDNENNVIITIDGKKGEIPPRIIKLELTRNSDRTNLTINVEAKRTTTYKYYLKTADGEYGNPVHEGPETTYTITSGISKEKSYIVKVEAINEYGTKEKELSEKDETPPTAVITNLPKVIAIDTTGKATVEHRDYESGVDISKCKWVLSTGKNNIGTEDKKYTGNFTSEIEEITISAKENGKYYLHVLTVDNQGNKTETISSEQIIIGKLVTSITTTNHGTINDTIDQDGNTVPIPGRFKIATDSGATIDDGIVIEDGSKNQFVWIPMANESDFPGGNIEPYKDGYPTEKTEYDTMKRQVLKYGGFYIGRYEAGVNTTLKRTAETEAQEVVCKAGVYPYNYVRWGESMSNIGTRGAVYLAQNMYQNKPEAEYIASTLCYNCQWNAICCYVEGTSTSSKSSSNKRSEPGLTGSLEVDVVKNIYDLTGNCREWVMGYNYINTRIIRGANYNLGATRNSSSRATVTAPLEEISFRCALYIK